MCLVCVLCLEREVQFGKVLCVYVSSVCVCVSILRECICQCVYVSSVCMCLVVCVKVSVCVVC